MDGLVLTREQVRDVDRRAIEQYGMTGLVLMENAGRGCADLLAGLGISGEVVVVAGKGNNAGDGFVIARHLENRGVRVRVLLLSAPDELRGDALANFRILEHGGTPMACLERPADEQLWRQHLEHAEWIVDALLGTGTRGEIRAPFDLAIDVINAAPGRVLAIDLPSGMDCDTGASLGRCIVADHTATLVALKPCFLVDGTREWTGDVHVLGIGVPRKLLEEFSK